MKYAFIFFLTSICMSCQSQEYNQNSDDSEKALEQNSDIQIGAYVVATFQDSKGNLWFGTLEKGVAKYDGNKVTYLTTKDGLASNRVVCIIEDKMENLWFGTGAGISKFDGKTFTNYAENEGLCSAMISHLLIDSKGVLWIGTWNGVCTYDDTQFKDVPLPYPPVETTVNKDTKEWITDIIEDTKGNIWIGRDAYGACIFKGNSIVHITTQEGLNSNNVQSITEDHEGNIWIGTRVAERDNADASKRFGKGGLNKYDGEKFTHFPEIEGLSESDVYGTYLDPSNNVWISTVSHGVYKYENNEFVHYRVPTATMSFLKDKNGNIWLGCAGGLYKINPHAEIINVTTTGPWN